ncbi:MAG: dihydrofolate reductase [Alphaproteobacteria bacterium]
MARSRPRFTAYVAASADGRISLDKRRRQRWICAEDWDFFQAELARADAVVCGRDTYLAAAARLRKRNTVVLTRRPKNMTRRGSVRFVNPRAADLAALFDGMRRVAVIGGAGVYREMLDQGLLDEVYLTLEPLLFGRGRELLEGGPTVQMRLRSSKRLNRTGSLLLRYAVVRSPDAASA